MWQLDSDATNASSGSTFAGFDMGGRTTDGAADAGTVCLSEASKSGKVFQIADIATGANAGTYFGKAVCPAATEAGVGALAGSW